MSTALTEAIQASDAAAKSAREFYAAHPTEEIAGSDDLLAESETHNLKMADLSAKAASLQGVEAGRERAGEGRKSAGRIIDGDDDMAAPNATKSFDEVLDEVPFGTGQKTYQFEIPRLTAKALLTLASINNEPTRAPGITVSAQDETTVADLLLQRTTDNNSLSYMSETTFTNAAAAVAQGAAKPESTLGFTKTTVPIEKIATWLPATDELLEDVAGIRDYISGRLMFMVRRREEGQILAGDGISPNLRGLLNAVGIQTQAKATDSVLTALYKGINKVRVTGLAEPTAIVMHPNDFQDVVLTRDDGGATAGTGAYFWGGPINGPQERIWGLPVRLTPLITENTALIVSRPFAEVVRRTGLTVTASSEHSTFFVENKVAILAEERLGLAIYRSSAFCTVTGI